MQSFKESTDKIREGIKELKDFLAKNEKESWEEYKLTVERTKQLALDPIKTIDESLDSLDRIEAKLKGDKQ